MLKIKNSTYTDKEVLERIENYAIIELTQNEIAFVDREDFSRVNEFLWYALYKENTRSFYPIRRQGKGKQALQNFIMNFNPTLDKEKRTVDHINRIPMDNWKRNLRIVSKSIQNINRRVYQNKNFWCVCYMLNGQPTIKTFRIGPEANGSEIAKQKAIAFKKQIDKEISEYNEPLYQPEYVDSKKDYNLKDIEDSNTKALRLRGIKQLNRIGFDGLRFVKNSWSAEWNKNGKHYSKRFKVTGIYDYKIVRDLAFSYYTTMVS